MSPLRAARSSRVIAWRRCSSVASGALARLRAVRSAERPARLRIVAARAFRMSFLADLIFGKSISSTVSLIPRSDVAAPLAHRQQRGSDWSLHCWRCKRGKLGATVVDVKALHGFDTDL